MTGSDVSVVIVNYNSGGDLRQCVAALAHEHVKEVVVVDNCSTDGSEKVALEAGGNVRLIRSPANAGFAGGANLGARDTVGDIVLFLNPDTIVSAGCVDALAEKLARSPGATGPVLDVQATGGRQFGCRLTRFGLTEDLAEPDPPFYIPGCALAINRSVFERVGGFDERYFLFVEDVEICWRVLQAGYAVEVCQPAHAFHRGGGSALGGYVRPNARYETTVMRMALRERNTIALMLACAPAASLAYLLPVILVRIFLEGIWGAVSGRTELSRQLLAGLRWNATNFHTTHLRRHSLTGRPHILPAQRQSRRLILLRVLLTAGIPRLLKESTHDASPTLSKQNLRPGQRMALALHRLGRRLFRGTALQHTRLAALLHRALAKRIRPQAEECRVVFGGIEVLVPSADASMIPALIEGKYETFGARLLQAVLKPGMSFLDVGANVGLFTVLAASRVGPEGRVVAVEPMDESRRMLERNLLDKQLTNVQVLALAASDSEHEVLLAYERHELGTARIDGHGGNSFPARSVALDDLLQDETFDCLKVDVEGHELPALRGATQIIERSRPVLMLEYNTNHHSRDLRVFLEHHFQRIWVVDDKRATAREVRPNELQRYRYANVIAAHSDVVSPLLWTR